MAYIETQRKIVYDTLKAFQGGRVTDESKVSERYVEDKLHDVRNSVIFRNFTGNKVRTKSVDNNWYQNFFASFNEEEQPEDAPFTVFRIPKVLNLPEGTGLMYVGGHFGTEQIPTVSSAAMLNSYLTHRDTKKRTFAYFMAPNELRVFNLASPDEIMVRAVFERPPEVAVFGKGFSQNKELLALENFRDNAYYPISGALLTPAKQELTKLVQTAFQTPVDRIDDSRQSTDYQRSDES